VAADYKSRGHGYEKKPVPGFVWLLAGLAIGLFVALIVYLDKQPQNTTSFGQAVQLEIDKLRSKPASGDEASGSSKPAVNAAANKPKEPRFNFYTILPELEVLIPEAEVSVPSSGGKPGAVAETNTTGSVKKYILQTGSFRNPADADKLKASLALLGLEADIQRVTVNTETWHRVRVGPYQNTRELYATLNRLHQHDINAMAMELK
jgi:cell division protein FtsN